MADEILTTDKTNINDKTDKPVTPDGPAASWAKSRTSDDQNPATAVSSRFSSTAPRSRMDQTRSRFKILAVAFGLMLSLAAGFLGGWIGSGGRDNVALTGSASTAAQRRIAASESQLISSIAKQVGPSVVSVDVTSQSAQAQTDLFGFDIQQVPRERRGSGTGIIISSDGLIVTNRHVVAEGTTDVNITLSDGTELENVKVVGRTADNDSLDVAFLKIEDAKGHKLTPAEIGNSGNVQVGDLVVAIGNALGQFNNTVTSGIISGYGRSVQAGDESGQSVENLNDLFQTDAAINQGNSGGPLVNSAGQVIGINTAVSGQGQNIGFAIPINDVNGLIKQVLKSGKFERSYLGVRYIPLTPSVAEQFELKQTAGAYIQPPAEGGSPSILEGSPAAKAGLKDGDVITAVDGTKIEQGKSLTSLIGRKAVGDSVKLTVIRDDKTITLNATVGAAPNS